MVVNALFDTGSSFGLFRRDAYSGPCGYARSYTCSDGNAPADFVGVAAGIDCADLGAEVVELVDTLS